LSTSARVVAELELPPGLTETRALGVFSKPRRKASVEEAIEWKSGSDPSSKALTTCYVLRETRGKYELGAGKPGKEAVRTSGPINVNDMTPTILLDGLRDENRFAFDQIFHILVSVSTQSQAALQLLASVFFRMAYMLDHKKNEAGAWRLVAPPKTMDAIVHEVAEVGSVPLRVLVYMAEVIALNEDVKYYTLGLNKHLGNGTGRRKNLLTYCNLAGVLMQKVSFADFLAGFTRGRGVSPIRPADVPDVMPLLGLVPSPRVQPGLFDEGSGGDDTNGQGASSPS